MTLLELRKNNKILDGYVGLRVVYKITNILNGKVYVGITSRIKRRVYEHNLYASSNHPLTSYIHTAIRHHGPQNFSFEVIDWAETDADLNNKEIYYITKFCAANDAGGYNLTLGGERGIPNDITVLKKIASAHKKNVAQYDLDGYLISTYESVRAAARRLSIPDTDIHRCHKYKWSRGGFMFRKFKSKCPPKIAPYTSNRGKNFAVKGIAAHNRIKCSLLNKKTSEMFFGESILELSRKVHLDKGTIHRIAKNPLHRKWAFAVLA